MTTTYICFLKFLSYIHRSYISIKFEVEISQHFLSMKSFRELALDRAGERDKAGESNGGGNGNNYN